LQVAPGARDAFQAGYAAGANDVFGDCDGGWDYDRPYVITYAIRSRRPAG
jgi:hypothetical protein